MPETEEKVNGVGVDDPLYIHNTDLTGVKLVAKIFEGIGYGSWRSIPQPSSTSATANKWQRCNDIVFSWILNSVSPEIADSILYSGTAEIAWSELEERFGQSNGAQLYSVQKKLTEFSQGSDSISTYFTKVKSVRDDIEGMGMNPKFIRGTIIMQNPLPKLAVIYNNLLQDERQREIHNSSQFQSDSAAMLAKNVNFKNNSWGNGNGNAANKGFQGYNKTGNPNYKGYNPNYKGKDTVQNQNQEKPPPPFYNNCKKYGHTVDSCYHLMNRNRRFAGNAFYNEQGNSQGSFSTEGHQAGASGSGVHPSNNSTETSTNDASTSSANFAGTSSLHHNFNSHSQTNHFSNTWILDTSATDHFCSNKALFSDFRCLDKPYSVSLPNGHAVKIDTVGTVHITSALSLTNVLLIPRSP
ncbi:uncharacterized protein LOC141588779 [Silene latifolia]|uniref:uncharacterized protein LOC141588779 n=1 Tax=Silene latifolia TaxID=37657 RepID=UPI003D787E83